MLGTVTTGQAQTLLTFDALPPGAWPAPGYSVIPNGYGGVNWNNFGVLDGYNLGSDYGYHTGIVSPNNVAFNLGGDPASISAVGGVFILESGYFTAALNIDIAATLRVQGFLGSAEVYDNTYTLSRTAPTFLDFTYLGVDRVTFFDIGPAHQPVAMDNLTIVVPEPSTVALAGLAAALGLSIGRRWSKTGSCGSRSSSAPETKPGHTEFLPLAILRFSRRTPCNPNKGLPASRRLSPSAPSLQPCALPRFKQRSARHAG